MKNRNVLFVFASFVFVGVLANNLIHRNSIPKVGPNDARSIAQSPPSKEAKTPSTTAAQLAAQSTKSDGPVGIPYLKARHIELSARQFENAFQDEKKIAIELFDLGTAEIEIKEFYQDDFGGTISRGNIVFGRDDSNNRYPGFQLNLVGTFAQANFEVAGRSFQIANGRGGIYLLEVDPKTQPVID